MKVNVIIYLLDKKKITCLNFYGGWREEFLGKCSNGVKKYVCMEKRQVVYLIMENQKD